MRISLILLLFSAVTLTPFFIERNRQIFHPIKLFAIVQVLLVAPAALVIDNDPSFLHRDVYSLVQFDVTGALTWTLLCYTLLNSFVYFGYYASAASTRGCQQIGAISPKLSKLDTRFYIGLFTGIGLTAFFLKLSSAGGFAFLLSNVTRRVEIQSGLGPLTVVASTAFLIAVILATRRAALLPSRGTLLTLAAVFAVAALCSTIFGGRKDTLQLSMTILIVFSICRPRFFLISVRSILILVALYLAVVLYYFSVLLYRSSNDLEGLLVGLPAIVRLTLDSYSQLLVTLSYLDSYIFTTNFFDFHNFYYWSTFYDLATAAFPSFLLPDKPPIDDGLYVRAASLGYLLQPFTPANTIQHNSWPGETLGNGYMNAGLLGVALLGSVLGTVLGRGYRWARTRPDSVFAMVLLSNLFLNFDVSNLRIIGLLYTAGAASLLLLLPRLFATRGTIRIRAVEDLVRTRSSFRP